MPSRNIPKDEIKNDSTESSAGDDDDELSMIFENNNLNETSSNSNASLSGLSNNSSMPEDRDDDDDDVEYAVHHPNNNRSLLQIPIILPREPSLDQLLREVSGTQNLLHLTHVTLKVTSNMVGLQRLNDFMPNLRALTLDGSQLNTLRDLGFNLNLSYLNVSRCGLKHFDGIAGLLSVQHLIADQNHIGQVSQLSNLPELMKLSLRGNKINDFATISFLILCNELHEIDLEQNPICQEKSPSKQIEFRQMIKKLIPQLLILDGKTLSSSSSSASSSASIDKDDSEDPSIISSEFNSSSLSSITYSESNGTNNNNNNNNNDDEKCVSIQKRSVSALDERMTSIHHEDAENQLQLINKRPSTADNHHQKALMRSNPLLQPICGNIIERVRNHKKKKNNQSKLLAWDSKSITYSSQSSSSSSLSLSFKSSNAFNNHSAVTAAVVVDTNKIESITSIQLKTSINMIKINENNFPKRLPQNSIDFQFDNIQHLNDGGSSGIAAVDESRNYHHHDHNVDENTINLLSAAKKWRQAYRKTCENLKTQQSL